MDSRERISLALNHIEADRIGIHDAPWITTINRWHREGLPEGKTPEDYFNYELWTLDVDVSLQLPRKIIEETDDYIIEQNNNGAITKNWKNLTSVPEMIDFTIKNKKDWLEHKERMIYNDRRLLLEENKGKYARGREKGKFITICGVVGYDKTQGLIGSEQLLFAIKDDPEWVKDMFETGVQVLVDTIENLIPEGFEFDGAFIFDDLGYRNTSFFSPLAYKELLFPYHKKLCSFLKSYNLPVILHSCGCVKDLIPYFIEAGFSCLQPLEVKAGMDLVQLKKEFGEKLSFMGGIDVRKMNAENPSEIEEEIKEKITFAKCGGGYIYHSDHSVPDDISFEQYCRVIELVLKYGQYEGK